jgi:hypothetical protein
VLIAGIWVINKFNFESVNKYHLCLFRPIINSIIFVLACLMNLHQLREKVPLHLLGLKNIKKMATKATAKKAAPAGKKSAAGATKAKPKTKK